MRIKIHTPINSRIAISLASLLFICVASCAEEAPEPVIRSVKTVIVQSAAGAWQRSFPGRVKALQAVDLAFQVPGLLTTFPVKEGQQLAQGELIGQLDARDFEQNLAAKKAQLDKAEQDMERYRQLWSKDAVPLADLQAKERNTEVAKSNYEIAKKKLDDTKIVAPFVGRIGRKYVESNEEVKAKQKIVLFQDLSRTLIEIDVPEAVVMRAKGDRSLKFTASFDNLPGRSINLTVHEFATEADPVTKTFPLTLSTAAIEDAMILPGMTATVSVATETSTSAGTPSLKIPVSAIFTNPDGEQAVWVVDESTMTVQERKVQVGAMRTSDAEINSGLKNGERIVTAGTHVLQDGMKVRLYESRTDNRTGP